MCDDKNGKSSKSDDENELSASDESEPEEAPSTAPFDPELDGEDDSDDDDVVEYVAPGGGQKTSTFNLKGGGSEFSSRSQSIFDCLDNVAKVTSSSLGQDNVIDGVFARPLPPLPSRKTSHPPSSSPVPAKKRGVPDYMVNPDRWTHYSLEDVPETSDKGNSRVAHEFLASLQPKKELSDSLNSLESLQKIIFSKPNRVGKEQTGNRQLWAERRKEKGMSLSHLDEEDEEGDNKRGAGNKPEQSTKNEDIKSEQTGVGKQKAKEDVTEETTIQAGFSSFKKSTRKTYRKTTGDS